MTEQLIPDSRPGAIWRIMRWGLLLALILLTGASPFCECEGAPTIYVLNLLPVPVNIYVVPSFEQEDPAGFDDSRWGRPESKVAVNSEGETDLVVESCEATNEKKTLWIYIRAVSASGGYRFVATYTEGQLEGNYRLVLDDSGFHLRDLTLEFTNLTPVTIRVRLDYDDQHPNLNDQTPWLGGDLEGVRPGQHGLGRQWIDGYPAYGREDTYTIIGIAPEGVVLYKQTFTWDELRAAGWKVVITDQRASRQGP
jgi:hypothetical protein